MPWWMAVVSERAGGGKRLMIIRGIEWLEGERGAPTPLDKGLEDALSVPWFPLERRAT